MAKRRHKLKGKLFRLIFQVGKIKACLKVVFFFKKKLKKEYRGRAGS